MSGGIILLLICIAVALKVNSVFLSYLILLVYISGILVMLLYLTNLVANFWFNSSWIAFILTISVVFLMQTPEVNSTSYEWSMESSLFISSLTLVLLALLLVLVLLVKFLNMNLTIRNFLK